MDTHTILVFVLFGTFLAFLFAGVPVAWALGGSALLITGISVLCLRFGGAWLDLDFKTFSLVIERLFGLLENELLVALPMFIFMGYALDCSGVAERLMAATQDLIGGMRGGLALAVIAIGVVLAASTGIIGASIVLLGLISVPAMLRQRYRPELAVGIVCGSGTLGILLPPSIMLIVMADRLQVPVKDLFMGAIWPGVLLAALYALYIVIYVRVRPEAAPLDGLRRKLDLSALFAIGKAIVPPAALIVIVLGSIVLGIASPTEASGLGAAGAFGLALANRKVSRPMLQRVLGQTMKTLGFLFAIFLGATCFALALRLLEGDTLIVNALQGLGLSPYGLVAFILIVIFLLGFFLDWIEITLIVLPLVAQAVVQLDFPWAAEAGIENASLVWFAILCAVVLQTSFLTPPVGFALFFVKGVCPLSVTLQQIYRGVIPFVILQLVALALLVLFPAIVTWLPARIR